MGRANGGSWHHDRLTNTQLAGRDNGAARMEC